LDYKENVGIDLHIHSTASDGTLTPTEILHMAQQLKLGAIAITDHDTISGTKEALQAEIPASIHFVTGVEISAAPIPPFDTAGSYHILGYFFRIEDEALNQTLSKLQNARQIRNVEIIHQLNNLGIDISSEDVHRETVSGLAGRPHIARALIQKGVVASINEAFDIYLGTGKPAYVDKFRISCQKAIELITQAGGIPVLAHPGLLEMDGDETLNAFFAVLKEMGLKGIEVYYPEHSDDQVSLYLDLTASHDLLVTGGSDFHGGITPDIKMGSGNGTLFVPFSLYERLEETAGLDISLSELEQTLGYIFHNRLFLEEAIRHSSFVNEQPHADMRDNERFEFLGDAVLNLVVGHLLMQKNPALNEGDLTKIRANMVNEHQLATIALSLNLGKHILLGKGEMQTGGHEKSSILADTLEAVIAAVYLDGGYPASFQMIETHFSHLMQPLIEKANQQDFKSQLQEFVQFLQQPSPHYRIFDETGPDHDKTFIVQLDVCDLQTHGKGKSKKTAEQDAAQNALKLLKSDDYDKS
jgi:ribonuclease III